MKTPFFLFSMISSALLLTANSYRLGSVSHCSSPLLIYSRTYPFVSRIASSPWALCMRASRSSSSASSSSYSGSGGDNSKGQKHKNLAPVYSPKTANQKTYCSCLSDLNASIVLGVGPAGTGKTLFACITAIQMLRRGEIHKIILTRPVVAVEEELGFLPGNMVMKMDPWTRPIFDVFLEYYAQKDVDAMVQSGTIEISPLAYMRGRTFKRAFIIADEMQNSSPNQMLMLITRIGEGSKMVITGDLKQSDRLGENGLNEFMNKIGRHRRDDSNDTDKYGRGVISVGGIRAVELMTQDVERSAIVKQVLALYDEPFSYDGKPSTKNPSNPSFSASLTPHSGFVANSSFSASLTPHSGFVANLNTVKNARLVEVGVLGITEEDLSSKVITVSLNPNTTTSFEMGCFDEYDERDRLNDAALIPLQHSSKYLPGENYGRYSTGKWTGW